MSESRKAGFRFGDREKRKSITLQDDQLVQIGSISANASLPTVISPLVPDLDLAGWIAGNRSFLERILQKNGAALFRGFQVNNVTNFERAAAQICRELFNENGEHPRTTGSTNVYRPVFYPPDKLLLWHNENSFNYRFPTRIMFGCVKPAEIGGETPLADSREVYRRLDSKIRRLFEEKQVMYVRNYSRNLGLDWETVFKTADRRQVEQQCRKSFFSFEWKADGTLRTRCVRPAVVEHPVTGEKTWFNQAQHWHFSCLDAETQAAFTKSFSEEDFPRQCYFGDGSVIEDSMMSEILSVYKEIETVYPWKTGDMVVIDNLLAAHGRNPFEGERKLLVAMGDLLSYDELK
jgi:alpha-ketoglutarate-dependent taurine dioxygenase